MDKFAMGPELGRGEFAVTYLCTEIATGHQYACKSISKLELVSKKTREGLQGEIESLKLINLLRHPNIASMRGVFNDENSVSIVMELCTGGELFDHINTNGPVGEPEAARMIKGIGSAIEACHNLGIVHRDIKLENLMFKLKDKRSPLKLIDFGFSTFCTSDEELNDIVGSVTYVAPEILEGHHGPKVDIWSMGVLLYVLLSGFYPFKSETLEEMYKASVQCRDDYFDKDPWPNISPGAKDLIHKMMIYNVNERLSASEVLKHPWILENV